MSYSTTGTADILYIHGSTRHWLLNILLASLRMRHSSQNVCLGRPEIWVSSWACMSQAWQHTSIMLLLKKWRKENHKLNFTLHHSQLRRFSNHYQAIMKQIEQMTLWKVSRILCMLLYGLILLSHLNKL